MAITKIQSESLNLADTYAFTGTVTGTPGITQTDVWRISSTFTTTTTNSNVLINSGWERADDATAGYVGSGMTESSGIFTFPETGIYQIRFQAYISASSAHYCGLRIFGTSDNSSYDQLASGDTGVADISATDYSNMSVACHFDCENTSTHKVKFYMNTTNNPTNLYGESTSNTTYVTFIRLGDT
jgi:hypothetical protein